MAVRAVLVGRRLMVEMPICMAAMKVEMLDTSLTWTVAVMPWMAFNSTSNLRMMMKMTMEDMTTIAKPRKMMMGVFAMAKAGWEK